MTTIKAIRLASLVTAINVLVASGFSIAAIIRPQYLVPAESVPTQASLLLAMYAAARTIPLALFALGAIYKQATPALLILGALAGAMQLLDAGIGLFEHDLGKCAGPLFIAVLQFFVVYLLHRSVRITPQTKRGSTHATARRCPTAGAVCVGRGAWSQPDSASARVSVTSSACIVVQSFNAVIIDQPFSGSLA